MAVLRFWLRHPGPCFVLVGGNLVFASTFDDPGPIVLAALSAFLLATLTQGLRLGWQASRPKTVLYTCLTLLPLAAFVLLWAGATRDGIRAGMTISEAVAAPRGLFLAVGTAQAVDGSTAHVSFGCRDQDRCWLEVGGQRPTVARSGLPATLESALGERAVVRQLTFHFRGRMLPLTTSFEVEFDPQGRVSRVSPMRSWD